MGGGEMGAAPSERWILFSDYVKREGGMFRVNGLDPTILLEVTSAWIGFWFYVESRLNRELWGLRDAIGCQVSSLTLMGTLGRFYGHGISYLVIDL